MPILTTDVRWSPRNVPRGEKVALRRLALPTEHGGWGFLLEPILLALIVAPSIAGAAFAMAAVAGFLTRQPLRFALNDLLRRKSYPRTAACWWLTAGYSAITLLALAATTHLAGASVLLPIVLASPLAAFQLVHDVNKRGRAMAPEIAGAAAMGSIAAAIAMSAGKAMPLAAALWCLAMLRSIPAIVFVRAVLGKSPRASAIALHLAAVAASIALWRLELAPGIAAFAMSALLVRAVLTRWRVEPARSVGIRELVFGTGAMIVAGVGYYWM
ncbi:MAG: YwiC-like family protein [Acidobacteriota bacterium]